jgi:hypothetical protein
MDFTLSGRAVWLMFTTLASDRPCRKELSPFEARDTILGLICLKIHGTPAQELQADMRHIERRE